MFSPKLFRLPAVLVLGVVFLVTGCDSSSSDGDAPPTIAPEAFVLDTELFSQDTSATKVQPGVHFTAAAFRVWPVSLIISANLVLPALIAQEALATDPFLEDGAWTWFALTSFNDQPYSFSLVGTPSVSALEWSLNVNQLDQETQELQSSFQLVQATTDGTGKNGSWSLFYPGNDSTSQNVLNATFDLSADSMKTVTFDVPATASSNAGDQVRYETMGSVRTFRWSQVATSIEHVITWDSASGAGSITATNYNGGVQACWNQDLDDVPCTP